MPTWPGAGVNLGKALLVFSSYWAPLASHQKAIWGARMDAGRAHGVEGLAAGPAPAAALSLAQA